MKKGWPIKRFEEVLEIRNGRNQREVESEDGRFPILGSAGSVMGYARDYICEAGAVIIGRKGTIDSPIFVDTPFWNVDTAFGLVAGKGLEPRFLYYYCLSYDFAAHNRGTTIPSLVKSDLLQISMPQPPLNEQRRIVGILDEAFAGIATAKANAEKNLQNARALFESHLQSVFSHRGKGWVEKPLGDVCEVKDGTHDSPKYVSEGIPFVTQKNIREQGLSFEKTKFITQIDHDDFYRRSNAARGDILISMIGANRGMACIIDDSRTFSIKNVGLVKQNKAMNQDFLLYFLKSPSAAEYVRVASKGGAQEFIGLTQLRAWPVPLPPLEQQKSLAEQFVNLASKAQRLESIYQQKLAALEALKKSLLHQAFSGNL